MNEDKFVMKWKGTYHDDEPENVPGDALHIEDTWEDQNEDKVDQDRGQNREELHKREKRHEENWIEGFDNNKSGECEQNEFFEEITEETDFKESSKEKR